MTPVIRNVFIMSVSEAQAIYRLLGIHFCFFLFDRTAGIWFLPVNDFLQKSVFVSGIFPAVLGGMATGTG